MLGAILTRIRDEELASPTSLSSRKQHHVPEHLRPAYVVSTDMFSILFLDPEGTFRVVTWEGDELDLTARGFIDLFGVLSSSGWSRWSVGGLSPGPPTGVQNSSTLAS